MYTSSYVVQEHQVPTCHIREYPRATVEDQEVVLHLAVKQYTPRDTFKAKQAVTIIGAHANGFPKELYEPLWDDLYQRLKAKGIRIRSIWIADVAHQGQSGVLNEGVLGNDPSWMDHPRDLFLMVNHFRQEMQRPIVGIGHSMGGNNLVNLSLMHPRLFTSLILIDPVIQRMPSLDGNFGPAKASTKRRDRWQSRTAAQTAFKRNKFYQAWDPRVLDNWIRFGLRDLPTKLYPVASPSAAPITPPTLTAEAHTASAHQPEVTLATTKHQEVFSFLRPNYPTEDNPYPSHRPNPVTHPDVDLSVSLASPFYRPEPGATFKRLPNLRPSVLYVFGDESALSEPILKADKLAQTGIGVGGSGGVQNGRVSEVTFKGVGHLIPMEVVGDTADAASNWIVPELERWAELEATHQRAWKAVPPEAKSRLSDDHIRVMNEDWSKMTAAEEKAWQSRSKL